MLQTRLAAAFELSEAISFAFGFLGSFILLGVPFFFFLLGGMLHFRLATAFELPEDIPSHLDCHSPLAVAVAELLCPLLGGFESPFMGLRLAVAHPSL